MLVAHKLPRRHDHANASPRFLGPSLINRRHARSFSRQCASRELESGRYRVQHLRTEEESSRGGIYGTKRYGTVRSPMTEWHGSSLASFPLFSHLRVASAGEICSRVCVCARAIHGERASARLQVPCIIIRSLSQCSDLLWCLFATGGKEECCLSL